VLSLAGITRRLLPDSAAHFAFGRHPCLCGGALLPACGAGQPGAWPSAR